MSSATSALQDAARMIRALEAAFARHANAGDAAALTDGFYAEDAQLLPPNAPLVKGKAALREFWTGFFASGVSGVKLETGDVGAAGDLAYSVGKYEYSQGGVRHTGKYVVVYRRQADGGYKAAVDSFNDNA